MATELEKLKLSALRDEKIRQQMRENSVELRELEKKLKAGYMNRERSAQIAEKEAMKYERTVSSLSWRRYWCSADSHGSHLAVQLSVMLTTTDLETALNIDIFIG